MWAIHLEGATGQQFCRSSWRRDLVDVRVGEEHGGAVGVDADQRLRAPIGSWGSGGRRRRHAGLALRTSSSTWP